MVNVKLLQQVQSSILNPDNPFDMGSFETCICAHAIAIAHHLPLPLNWQSGSKSPAEEGAELLGLSTGGADLLFHQIWIKDREKAVEVLERLIKEHTKKPTIPAPEEELVCL